MLLLEDRKLTLCYYLLGKVVAKTTKLAAGPVYLTIQPEWGSEVVGTECVGFATVGSLSLLTEWERWGGGLFGKKTSVRMGSMAVEDKK